MSADTEQGRPSYDDHQFLDAIDELEGPATNTEIADALDCDRVTVYHRTKDLEDQGLIAREKVHGVYENTLTDKGRREVEEQ